MWEGHGQRRPPLAARDLSRPPRSPSLARSLALRSFIVCVRPPTAPSSLSSAEWRWIDSADVVAATAADCRGAPSSAGQGKAGFAYDSTQSQSTSKFSKCSTVTLALLSDPNEETLIIVAGSPSLSLARSSSGSAQRRKFSLYNIGDRRRRHLWERRRRLPSNRPLVAAAEARRV